MKRCGVNLPRALSGPRSIRRSRCLATHPDIGHTRPDLADERHRIWPVRHLLIIYRPHTKPLQVVRIWHAKRGTP